MGLLQFILDTMTKFKKPLSKIISDLEESSPRLKNSLLEISPVNFCVNIKNHKKIYEFWSRMCREWSRIFLKSIWVL